MATLSHKIGRLKFVIDLPHSRQHEKLYADIISLYRRQIEKLLLEILDEYDVPDRVHRFDRITLNIGTAKSSQLQSHMIQGIRRKLTAWLARHMTRGEKMSPAQIVAFQDYKTGRSARAKRSDYSEVVNIRYRETQLLKQIVSDGFLHGGHEREEEDLGKIIESWVEEKPLELVRKILSRDIRPQELQRIKQLLSPSAYAKWSALISSHLQPEQVYLYVIDQMKAESTSFPDFTAARKKVLSLASSNSRALETFLRKQLTTQQYKNYLPGYLAIADEIKRDALTTDQDTSLDELLVDRAEIGRIEAQHRDLSRAIRRYLPIDDQQVNEIANTVMADALESQVAEIRRDPSPGKRYFGDLTDLSGVDIFSLVQELFSSLEDREKTIMDYLNSPMISKKLKSALKLLAFRPKEVAPRNREINLLFHMATQEELPWWWEAQESDLPELKKMTEVQSYSTSKLMKRMVVHVPSFTTTLFREIKKQSDTLQQQIIRHISQETQVQHLFEMLKVLTESSVYAHHRLIRELKDELSQDTREVYFQLYMEILRLMDTYRYFPINLQDALRELPWEIPMKTAWKPVYSFDEREESSEENEPISFVTEPDVLLDFLRQGVSSSSPEILEEQATQRIEEIQKAISAMSITDVMRTDFTWVGEPLLRQWSTNNEIGLETQMWLDLTSLRASVPTEYHAFLTKVEVLLISRIQRSNYQAETLIRLFIELLATSQQAKRILAALFDESQNNIQESKVIRELKESIKKTDLRRRFDSVFPDESSRMRTYKKLWDTYGDLQEIPVKNAGLVLVWPFLSTLFEKLDYLDEDGQFVSKEIQAKAVVLLHFLSTNSEEYEEYHLVLNKVMCGFPIDEPIEPGFIITETEKRLVGKLLGAVVDQWKALKNTSINALRGSFLLRNGVLYNKDHSSWILKVDKKSYDLLIGKLPWGFSMIRMRWVMYTIKVDWDYNKF